MASFFRKVNELHLLGNLPGLEDDYRSVESVRRVLAGASANFVADFDNLESVFNAIEIASLAGGMGDLGSDDLDRAKSSLVRLIAAALERTQIYSFGMRNGSTQELAERRRLTQRWQMDCLRFEHLDGPRAYRSLVQSMISLLDGDIKHHVSVISFNYDLGLEVAMLARGITPRYSVNTDHTATGREIDYCKLHGSLNWFRDTSGTISALLSPIQSACRQLGEPHEHTLVHARKDTTFPLSPILEQACSFNKLDPLPVIVPPTETKGDHRQGLREVWRNAFSLLKQADSCVIIGYSMPDTDQFFRHLLTVAAADPKIRNGLWVFDPNPAIGEKYSRLIGPSMRGRWQFYARGVDSVSSAIRHCLDKHKTLLCTGETEDVFSPT